MQDQIELTRRLVRHILEDKEERKNSYFLLLIIENSTVNQQFLEEILWSPRGSLFINFFGRGPRSAYYEVFAGSYFRSIATG